MCKDAPQPDPALGEAAKASAQLGRDALDFYKGIYESDLKPMQLRQQELATKVTDSFLADSQLAREEARRRIDDDKANADLRAQVKADAMGYDSQANIDRRMGIAAAAANQQFSNARDQSLRSLSRYGVNPNSSAFARTNERLTRDQALTTAGMQTGAAFDTMDRAIALRAGVNEAASGRSNSAGQFMGIAGSNLSGAMGAGSQSMADARANAGMMGQGYGTALGGIGQAGNLYGQEFGQRMAGYNAQMGAISGLAGAAGTYFGLSARPPGKADGGEIHEGEGPVSGPGGPVDDKIPAMLSNGEYVIPADVVKAKGVEFFDKLLNRYHTPAAEQRMGLRRK